MNLHINEIERQFRNSQYRSEIRRAQAQDRSDAIWLFAVLFLILIVLAVAAILEGYAIW